MRRILFALGMMLLFGSGCCGNNRYIGRTVETLVRDSLRIGNEIWAVIERPDSSDDGIYVLGRDSLIHRYGEIYYHSSEMAMMVQDGKILKARRFRNFRREGLDMREIYEELNSRFPYDKFPGIRDKKYLLTFEVSGVKVNRRGEITDSDIKVLVNEPIDTATVISEFKSLLHSLPPVTFLKVRDEYIWNYDKLYIPMPQRFNRQLGLYGSFTRPFLDNLGKAPQFDGGHPNLFTQWVNEHLRLPESVIKNGARGRVILSFRINEEGYVDSVKVLRSHSPEFDAEAVRVVSSSPRWEPAKDLQGDSWPMKYTFPVIFQPKKN